jgi:hypothetical protein
MYVQKVRSKMQQASSDIGEFIVVIRYKLIVGPGPSRLVVSEGWRVGVMSKGRGRQALSSRSREKPDNMIGVPEGAVNA